MDTTSKLRSPGGISRTLLGLGAGAALVLVMTGCGPTSDDLASATRADDASSQSAQWGTCMRAAGFDVQDPDEDALKSGVLFAPPGVAEDVFHDAARECLQEVGIDGVTGEERDKWEREYAAVEDCIRKNGYPDFPAQEPGVLDMQGYPRAEEPEFEQVFADCIAAHSPDTKTGN
ncbi:hypothetical protein [Microbacterium sp. NPDC089695]|uniref:hypothetical protein n=1 Tax=Microbacterium sp. NPDC089695 TaxID=3364198 RepID=UPI003810A1E5